jgi:hypothetical protein
MPGHIVSNCSFPKMMNLLKNDYKELGVFNSF